MNNVKSIVLKALRILDKDKRRVLDLGCGLGVTSLALARNDYKVTAIDISKNKVDELNDILGEFKEFTKEGMNIVLNCSHQDIRKFNFGKYEDFDLTLSLNVFNFMNKTEITKVISDMKKHTSSEGIIVISAFTIDNPDKKLFSYLFEKEELRNLFKDWKIWHYDEFMGEFEKHEGEKFHRHSIVELIAQKTTKDNEIFNQTQQSERGQILNVNL